MGSARGNRCILKCIESFTTRTNYSALLRTIQELILAQEEGQFFFASNIVLLIFLLSCGAADGWLSDRYLNVDLIATLDEPVRPRIQPCGLTMPSVMLCLSSRRPLPLVRYGVISCASVCWRGGGGWERVFASTWHSRSIATLAHAMMRETQEAAGWLYGVLLACPLHACIQLYWPFWIWAAQTGKKMNRMGRHACMHTCNWSSNQNVMLLINRSGMNVVVVALHRCTAFPCSMAPV